LERWAGLLGLIALGGEAVAAVKGVNAATRAARIENVVQRGSTAAEVMIGCLRNSFVANTKVWVSQTTNDPTNKAKSTLETTKAIVKTALTAVAISSITVGTQVLAHNEQNKLESSQEITATINHTDPITVKLTLETNDKKLEVIEATPEHPFYALLEPKKNANGVWVNAGELQPNNWLRRANGETGIVKKLEWLTQTKRMYNLTVARDHTFFVGDGQWLVHNAECIPHADFDAAREAAFKQAGIKDGEAIFTTYDPLTGTVVEFLGPNGAKVNYDAPHADMNPLNGHDMPHVGSQTPGRRNTGGGVRTNNTYVGPQHPSR
jgi:hypothetical protein